MIKDEDISIVVQGPILTKSALDVTEETTKLVCKRLKKLFPKSELILSTWENEDTSSLHYDKLVLSKDPGATWFNYDDHTHLNNCNRLIVSTRAGIKASSRKYVFKVRSDLFLVSKNFLNHFYSHSNYNHDYKFVKNRIIAFSIYSIVGHKTSLFTMQRPYHISDWAYFGYKEDLLNLYDIPLTVEPEFSQWFLSRCKNFHDMEPGRLWKMPPEQYVTTEFLKKHIDIDLEHTVDTSNNNMEKSAKLLVNNFLILDQTQFSLISLKYINFQLLFEPLLASTAIFYSSWLEDYQKLCCPTLKFSEWLKYKKQIYLRKFCYKVINYSFRRLNMETQLIKRISAYLLKKIAKDPVRNEKIVVN